jgi:hypothetical protein
MLSLKASAGVFHPRHLRGVLLRRSLITLMSDQLALSGSSALRTLMRGHSKVSSVRLGECIITPEIAFDLSKNRGLVALQNARHL